MLFLFSASIKEQFEMVPLPLVLYSSSREKVNNKKQETVVAKSLTH